MQDYSPEDYEEVMSIAEDSGVAGQIVDFRAAVEDSSTVATFNGTENAEPIRRVFLCTAREVLLIEMGDVSKGGP